MANGMQWRIGFQWSQGRTNLFAAVMGDRMAMRPFVLIPSVFGIVR